MADNNTFSSYGQGSTSSMRTAEGAKGGAKILGSFLDYSIQKQQLGFYELQAQELEINAIERSNMLAQQFNQSLGNTAISAAQRGLKQSSGSVRATREISAKNVGQDIQTMRQNARMKSSALRSKMKIGKAAAKGQMLAGVQSGMMDIAKSMGGGA